MDVDDRAGVLGGGPRTHAPQGSQRRRAAVRLVRRQPGGRAGACAGAHARGAGRDPVRSEIAAARTAQQLRHHRRADPRTDRRPARRRGDHPQQLWRALPQHAGRAVRRRRPGAATLRLRLARRRGRRAGAGGVRRGIRGLAMAIGPGVGGGDRGCARCSTASARGSRRSRGGSASVAASARRWRRGRRNRRRCRSAWHGSRVTKRNRGGMPPADTCVRSAIPRGSIRRRNACAHCTTTWPGPGAGLPGPVDGS